MTQVIFTALRFPQRLNLGEIFRICERRQDNKRNTLISNFIQIVPFGCVQVLHNFDNQSVGLVEFFSLLRRDNQTWDNDRTKRLILLTLI